MRKLILYILCIASLGIYSNSVFGMQRTKELLKAGLAKSTSLAHRIMTSCSQGSQIVQQDAKDLWTAIATSAHSLANMTRRGLHTTKGLPRILSTTAHTIIQTHPKKSLATAICAGTLGIFFAARSRFVRTGAQQAKEALANRLLHSGIQRMVEWALRLGADINHSYADGKTALHQAAEHGKEHLVNYLITHQAHISLEDNAGYKPIHYTSQYGHTSVIDHLLEAGENIDALTQEQRQSPLHIAAAAGQLEMTRHLIQHGANDNLGGPSDQDAAALALAHEHRAVTQYLTQIRPSNEQDWFTRILHSAIDSQDLQRARIALNSGASFASQDPANTPLLRTIGAYDQANPTALDLIADVLVQKGTRLHFTDAQGNTPLHHAVRQNNIRLASLFLRCGADVNAQGADEQHAITIALEQRNRAMATLLMNHRAQLTEQQRMAYQALQ